MEKNKIENEQKWIRKLITKALKEYNKNKDIYPVMAKTDLYMELNKIKRNRILDERLKKEFDFAINCLDNSKGLLW